MQPEDLKQIRGVVKEELETYHEETFMPAFGKYTEEVLLPIIEENNKRLEQKIDKVDEKIGKLRSDMIDHVTRQINHAKAEIIKEIRAVREKDRVFKATVIEILQRSNLARPHELSLLRDLIDQRI